MENIVTVTGIRPDFIRMSEIFKKLDTNFNHSLIHTGQHYDEMMSDVFFRDLDIREPDMNLHIGGPNKPHYQQTADLSVILTKLIKTMAHQPDLIIFLGDSNSVLASVPLKKEGYKIAHIEAGMRSHDKRMLEEINRTICDHCSDYHFVYHQDYKQNLVRENLPEENIFIVGNTIVEVFNKHKETFSSYSGPTEEYIVLDIHRPENFKDKARLRQIIFFANLFAETYGVPVYMLKFKRTQAAIEEFGLPLKKISCIEPMSYKDYLKFQSNSLFIMSDSGTAQEEPALMHIPVVVPRDFTERPQSMTWGCSYMLDLNIKKLMSTTRKVLAWLDGPPCNTQWLGTGNTSELIIDTLKQL
jgi:UDP-N-acetylglucosamine 2-epimerase